MAVLLIADSLDRETLIAVSGWLQRQSPLVPIVLNVQGVPAADVDATIIASALPPGIAHEERRRFVVEVVERRIAGILESLPGWVPGVIIVTNPQEDVPQEALETTCRQIEDAISLPVWIVDLVGGHAADSSFPQGLQEVFDKVGIVNSLPGLLEIPLFVDAAGGVMTARSLVQAGVQRRDRSEDAFLGEVLDVLKKVLQMWGPEAAASWLRSPNGFLGGARPIQVLALNGPDSVLDSLDAVSQFVYS
jgi:hypothetical protein